MKLFSQGCCYFNADFLFRSQRQYCVSCVQKRFLFTLFESLILLCFKVLRECAASCNRRNWHLERVAPRVECGAAAQGEQTGGGVVSL